ncbi:MAG: multidrug efflux pump subunit AcrA (membrane-fusion protein) [Saprospiraceae bacterium]|jgi:multidrug efflux pump subunit AcrA (membrane-fusion protein)
MLTKVIMNLRQVIISAIGIGIIAIGFLIGDHFGAMEKPVPPKPKRVMPTVFTQAVQNKNTPIIVTASGSLEARDRVDIFAEVQGIFEYSASSFKPGTYYKKGSTLIRINADEARSTLRAQKSSLYNQMVALLPDLRFDYPDALPHWETYINGFNIEQTLQPFPTPTSDKEKLFIAGRNINSVWYNVKNLEDRIAKYSIYAPFGGILTEAVVNKGTLVRAGQKLGTFINPNIYELPVAINSNYADLLKVGNAVTLHNVEGTRTWSGKVNRLNILIDPTTQTLQAYIRVNGKDLREGMYLEAELTAKEEPNTYELSRKLLTDNNKLFFVKDSLIELTTIEAIYFKENTVVVRGLPDGMSILTKSVPGAFEGMKVKIAN